MSSRSEEPIIRAGEIGQYVFCARAWWYARVKGYRSENLATMRQGAARHRRHGRMVTRSYFLRWLAVVLLILGGAFFVIWLLLGLGG